MTLGVIRSFENAMVTVDFTYSAQLIIQKVANRIVPMDSKRKERQKFQEQVPVFDVQKLMLQNKFVII